MRTAQGTVRFCRTQRWPRSFVTRFRSSMEGAPTSGSGSRPGPQALVRLVGYFEAVTHGLILDLVPVTSYDVAGNRIVVPRRIEPTRPDQPERSAAEHHRLHTLQCWHPGTRRRCIPPAHHHHSVRAPRHDQRPRRMGRPDRGSRAGSRRRRRNRSGNHGRDITDEIRPHCSPTRAGPFDRGLLHGVLAVVPAGRWTTYGELARAVGTQPFGGHVPRCTDCPIAWRWAPRAGPATDSGGAATRLTTDDQHTVHNAAEPDRTGRDTNQTRPPRPPRSVSPTTSCPPRASPGTPTSSSRPACGYATGTGANKGARITMRMADRR